MKNPKILLLLLLIVCAASPVEASGKGLRDTVDVPSYMGMVSIQGSPMIRTKYPIAFEAGIHTSHGVYFPKSGLYTGVALGYSVLYNMMTLNAHVRYHLSRQERTSFYLGAEAGPSFSFPAFGSDVASVDVNCAAEAGILVNFSRVSLDIGLGASFPGLTGSDFMFLPVRVGIVF